MPAQSADIAAAIRNAVIAQWSSVAIDGRYPSARDALADPSAGYFDALADAQALIAARGALIGTERRRFSVAVHDLLWLDPTAGALCVAVVDAEQGLNATMIVTRFEIDLEAETTTVEVFG